MSDDVTYIDETRFLQIRNVGREGMKVYCGRLKHQLTKCKLNIASNEHPRSGVHRGYKHPRCVNVIQKHSKHAKPIRHTSSILGLLNKVSPKSIDSVATKIIDLAMASCVLSATVAIIDHSLKQPVYMSLFIRLIGELSARCGDRAKVVSVVDDVIQRHIGHGILANLPPATSQHDYDGFCARLKGARGLMATVAFVVGCIRAHLTDTMTIDTYADYICANLGAIADVPDLETLLDVIKTFQSSADGCAPEGFVQTICAWAETLQGTPIFTTRARFKLLDIFDRSFGSSSQQKKLH